MENQQLIKKDRSANSYSKIFPWTFTDLVLDRVTKESLDNILVRNNFIALPYVGSKAATRLQVPMKNRRRGIWLSYIDYAGTLTVEYYNDNNLDDNHWQDSSYWLPYNTAEFQPASVSLSALAQEVFDWINSQITTAVKLNPEDLQKNSSGQIEEANRAYDTSTFSGLGYRILRKNIQSNKNVLTQSMINMPNNVYKIRYDFDLNGATINLPANSVLQFVGGSIKNGTLNGNNTVIEADSNAVIFDSVVIEGTWNVEHIYDSWFAFNTSPSYISNQIITNILALSNDDVYNTIHFDADRTYYFELPYKGRANLGDDVRPNYWKLNTEEYAFLRIFTGVTSNTHLIFNNTLQMIPTNQGAYNIFFIENKENIKISGIGCINGEAKNHLYTDPFVANSNYYGEWGHIFNIRSCNNIVIKDITLAYAFGDGINFSNAISNINNVKIVYSATKNVTVDGIKVLYARRNGISLGGNNYSVSNVYFEGCGSDAIKGTAPKCAIDFENDFVADNPTGLCTNVVMSSCKFKDNQFDISSTIRDDLYEVPRGELVTINNCNFTAPLRLNRTNGLTFNDCHIKGLTSHDNSIGPWYGSKDLVFNNCIFDELNPYLVISAEEQNKKFINPTYPQNLRYSTSFQSNLAKGRCLKFTIPKPLVGEIEFTALCSNSGYSANQMPNNTTIYTFGSNQRVSGIRDVKLYTPLDSSPRYAMYKYSPVFSNINYSEDPDNFIIYFTIGGELINDTYDTNTSVNIFMTSKIKLVVIKEPTSGNPSYSGMYGGEWSEVTKIYKEVINVSDIPASVTFPNKDLYKTSEFNNLPKSLSSYRGGDSIFVLDSGYRRPVFWDSYNSTFRTADGNRALSLRVTNTPELDALTSQLTLDDRGYIVYHTIFLSYLRWNGYSWINEDGSLYDKVRFVKAANDIAAANTIFSYSNITYKIVGNIDLDGGTLTIATGSTLDFQGGSFSNGTLVGNNTKIKAGLNKIFDTNITLSGTWNVDEAYPEWFGATIGSSDSRLAIQLCLNSFNTTKLSSQTYTLNSYSDEVAETRTCLIVPNGHSLIGNKIYELAQTNYTLQIAEELNPVYMIRLESNSSIKNLYICGNSTSRNNGAICIGTNGFAKHLLLENVLVRWGAYGFSLKTFLSTVINCQVANSNIGFRIYGDTSTNNFGTSTTLMGCYGIGIINTCYQIESMIHSSVIDCACDSSGLNTDGTISGDYIYDIINSRNISINNCGIEICPLLMQFRQGCRNIDINGGIFTINATLDSNTLEYIKINVGEKDINFNNLRIWGTNGDPLGFIKVRNGDFSCGYQFNNCYFGNTTKLILGSNLKLDNINIVGNVKVHYNDIPNKGLTSTRPSLTNDNLYNGFMFFDLTLNKYICWNGTTWTNLDGSALT